MPLSKKANRERMRKLRGSSVQPVCNPSDSEVVQPNTPVCNLVQPNETTSRLEQPLKGSEKLAEILKKSGFKLDRTKGSHQIYYHEVTRKRVVVPMHKKDLPKGTLLEILKQAGITKDELSDLL